MSESLDLYITNTETLYPSQTDYSDVIIRLYGRTRNGESKRVTVTGFQPYFYAAADEREDAAPAEIESLVRYEETETIPLRDRFADRTPWREPTELVKVITQTPYDINEVSQHFSKTWGGDVLFTERLRIDKEIRTGVRLPVEDAARSLFEVEHSQIEPVEMTDVEPRVVTLDIETDDRDSGFPDPGDARILSVVAHDSYNDECVGFVDRDEQSLAGLFDLHEPPESLAEIGFEHVDELRHKKHERGMLNAFAEWLTNRDPDLVCGWNSGDDSSDGFDLPHLMKRMNRLGSNPARLSREGGAEVTDYDEVHLDGRSCYDLMDGWEDTKFTNPRSTRLDYVAGQALDDAKIEHPDMGYFEMYREDPRLFLDYNAKDTQLTVDINEAENVLGFKQRLKNMVGVDWERTHENNEFIEMSVRRKCREHGLAMITMYDNEWVRKEMESDSDDVNYEGAYVFPSFSGVVNNVCGVDLASLYPMTQHMLNASPDTRIDRKKAWKHDIPHIVAENGQTFRDDVDGIIRELVDEYHEVKAEFKAERNAAEYGTAAWEEAAEAYNVTKTIYNSFYGYSGWDKSPLYNPHDAAAITLTGQRVIKRTAEYIGEEGIEGSEVIYGDTDSNYVTFPDEWGQERTLREAEAMCDELENTVYPELCDEFNIPREKNRWEIEVEMRAERMFQDGNKKRYSYLKTWDEGDDFDEVVNEDGDADLSVDVPDHHGKFAVTGFACVKSNFAKLTQEIQEETLEAIVRGADKSDVADLIYKEAAGIDSENPDWERLGMPQGLGKKLDEHNHTQDDYYSFTNGTPKSAHPRGAYFSNKLLDVDLSQGSSPMRAYLLGTEHVENANGKSVVVDVISYETNHDLESVDHGLQMDVSKMQHKVLRNPMQSICDSIGLDVDAVLAGQVQTGLSAFA